MKKAFVILQLYLVKIVVGQNMIVNGSFEDIKQGRSFVNDPSRLDDCKQWETVYDVLPPSCGPHSPDWIDHTQGFAWICQNMKAYDGSRYVRSARTNYELFQQNVPIQKARNYFLSMMLRTDSGFVFPSGSSYPNCYNRSSNPTYSPGPFVKVAVYFSKEKINFKDETFCFPSYPESCNLLPNDYKKFKRPASQSIKELLLDVDIGELIYENKWMNFIYYIDDKDLDTYNWISFMPIKEDASDCNSDVIYYDDLYLSKLTCNCPPDLRIENKDYASGSEHFLQSSKRIIAGYDASVNTPNGNVTVGAGANVKYTAGDFVELRPGFFTEIGSFFVAQVGNCEFTQGTMGISKTNVFTPNGDGINDNFIVPTSNATDYRLKIYSGQYEQLVVDQTGVVPDNGIIDINFPAGWPCNRTYQVVLYISNCNVDSVLTWPVSIIGCGVSTKKEFLEIEKSVIKVFPNPFQDYIEVIAENGLKIEEISILDITGRQVKNYAVIGNYTRFETHILPKGSYVLKVKVDNTVQKFFTIKQ